MKSKIFTLLIILFSTVQLFSQSKWNFDYQVILKDKNEKPISVKEIDLEIRLINQEQKIVFEEIHKKTTNENGLISIQIGSISGGLEKIDWSSENLFLNVKANKDDIGTTQLISVPYSMYCLKSKSTENIDFSESSSYKNINWCVIGDSQTVQGFYIQPIINSLKINKVFKIAEGGKTLAWMASEERLKQIPIDAKLITVMGGVNDWSQNRELGTIDDIENTTIYGALNLIVSYISKNYPQSKLVLICPPYAELEIKISSEKWPSATLNKKGINMHSISKAINDVGEKWGIPVANTYKTSGINAFNITYFMRIENDGKTLIHPNTEGGKRISSVLLGVLNSLPELK